MNADVMAGLRDFAGLVSEHVPILAPTNLAGFAVFAGFVSDYAGDLADANLYKGGETYPAKPLKPRVCFQGFRT